MSKCEFYDPVALGTYQWHTNYEDRDGPSRDSNTDFEGKSSDIGVIGLQGEDQPLIMSLSGTIRHLLQFQKFWQFRTINNSFRFTDFDDGEYEVQMTAFRPRLVRKNWNPADPLMRFNVYEYQVDLRILSINSGPLAGLGLPL